MWHASVATIQGAPPIAEAKLRKIALISLIGVGDPELGQWEEWTRRAYHIRRRLKPEEQALVGPAVDIRGTEEAQKRAKAILDLNPPPVLRQMIVAEMLQR